MFAQDMTLHFMRNIPQSNYTNLTYFPDYKFSGGIPFLTMYNINFTSPFSGDDVISKIVDTTAYLDPGRAIKNMKDLNAIRFMPSIEIFSSGWVIGNNYFTLNLRNRFITEVYLPKAFLELGWYGNEPYIGKTMDLSGIGFEVMNANELSFSYTRKFDKLIVGGRIKYLQGLVNVNTAKSEVKLTTDTATYWLTGRADVEFNMSGPIDTNGIDENFSAFDYLFNFKNPGFGIDLGAEYFITDKLSVSANIIDLGFITWTTSPKNYKINDASFTFEGFRLDSLISGEDTYFENFTDSVSDIFAIQKTTNNYTTALRTSVIAGASYSLTEKDRFGVFAYGRFRENANMYNLTLHYNRQVGKWLNASVNYNLTNQNTYHKLGAGLGFKLGGLQLAFVSDNVLSYFYPMSAKQVHFMFAMNFIKGNSKKDTEQE